jgi:hypothetical protein
LHCQAAPYFNTVPLLQCGHRVKLQEAAEMRFLRSTKGKLEKRKLEMKEIGEYIKANTLEDKLIKIE